MGELLPCPFCGGEAMLQEQPPHEHHIFAGDGQKLLPDHPGSFTVECASCNCGLIFDTRAEAIAAWNRRPSPEGRREVLDGKAINAMAVEYMEANGFKDSATDQEENFWLGHLATFAMQVAALQATPARTGEELPAEMLAVLRDPRIPLEGEGSAVNLVVARGCKPCLRAEHPYWHQDGTPCPQPATTVSASPGAARTGEGQADGVQASGRGAQLAGVPFLCFTCGFPSATEADHMGHRCEAIATARVRDARQKAGTLEAVYAPPVEARVSDEPAVKRYAVYLCDLCVAGKGGECHTPGCSLWIKRAPDVPLISPAVVAEYGYDPMCEPLEAATRGSLRTGEREAAALEVERERGRREGRAQGRLDASVALEGLPQLSGRTAYSSGYRDAMAACRASIDSLPAPAAKEGSEGR